MNDLDFYTCLVNALEVLEKCNLDKIEMNKEQIKIAIEQIKGYKQEIERLKEKNEELRALYESEREVKDDYKSKNNKAIEYIDRRAYSNISNSYDELYNGQIEELVDILKGVDKE